MAGFDLRGLPTLSRRGAARPMSEFRGEALACARSGWPVFSQLDFTAVAGDALILVGPNGAGKSSLLRVMAGLLRPAAGRLLWEGRPVDEDDVAHAMRLHYVGHADAVKPTSTVAETLTFWARFRGVSREDVAERVEAALSAFGIGHLAHLPGGFLSQGQRRRASLARLVVSDSPLWLLDEPRTALDTSALALLDMAIEGHRAGGGIVVAALHGGDYPPGALLLDLAAFRDEA